uniref:Uncharacterized protein n=1 Tax=Arundo donax TaxID=35708 RepID=A0A0A9CAD5_ARUDO
MVQMVPVRSSACKSSWAAVMHVLCYRTGPDLHNLAQLHRPEILVFVVLYLPNTIRIELPLKCPLPTINLSTASNTI